MDQKGKGTLWVGPALPVLGPRPSLKAAAPPEAAGGSAQAVESGASRWKIATSVGCLCALGSESCSQRPYLLHALHIGPDGPQDTRSINSSFECF